MSELSPGLLAALATTAKHLEPVEAKADPVVHKYLSKKTIKNRKRSKLAAQSRKRNRR